MPQTQSELLEQLSRNSTPYHDPLTSVTDGTLSNIDFVLNFATDLNAGNSFTTAVDRDGFSRLAPAKQVEGMRR